MAFGLCLVLASVAPGLCQAGDGAELAAGLRGPNPDDAIRGDWRVSLRGAYIDTGAGGGFETALAPEGSVTFLAPGRVVTLRGSADLVLEGIDQFRIGSIRTGVEASNVIDPNTDFTARADLSLSRAAADDPGASPYIRTAPLVGLGTASVGIVRDFGRLRGAVNVSGLSERFGASHYSNGTWRDNKGRNRTGFGVSGRVDMELTPIVSGFANFGLDREIYERAPIPAIAADSWTYSGRAGLAAQWASGVSAAGWAGYGVRRFDDARAAPAHGLLYGMRLGYVTSDRLNLAAELDSRIAPPGEADSAMARFAHDLRLEARYQVNPWITGRASSGYDWTRFAGLFATQTGFSAGFGADFLLSERVFVSADYAYRYEKDHAGDANRSNRLSFSITHSR